MGRAGNRPVDTRESALLLGLPFPNCGWGVFGHDVGFHFVTPVRDPAVIDLVVAR